MSSNHCCLKNIQRQLQTSLWRHLQASLLHHLQCRLELPSKIQSSCRAVFIRLGLKVALSIVFRLVFRQKVFSVAFGNVSLLPGFHSRLQIEVSLHQLSSPDHSQSSSVIVSRSKSIFISYRLQTTVSLHHSSQSSSVIVSRSQSSSVIVSRLQSSLLIVSRSQSSSVIVSRSQPVFISHRLQITVNLHQLSSPDQSQSSSVIVSRSQSVFISHRLQITVSHH